jgi:hypothetical protein
MLEQLAIVTMINKAGKIFLNIGLLIYPPFAKTLPDNREACKNIIKNFETAISG